MVQNSGGSGNNWGKVIKFALPPAGAAAGSLLPTTVFQFRRNVAPFGAAPISGLFKAADGTLYGCTSDANSGPGGVIYKIDTAGNYGLVYDLSSGIGALDRVPRGPRPCCGQTGFFTSLQRVMAARSCACGQMAPGRRPWFIITAQCLPPPGDGTSGHRANWRCGPRIA